MTFSVSVEANPTSPNEHVEVVVAGERHMKYILGSGTRHTFAVFDNPVITITEKPGWIIYPQSTTDSQDA